MDYIDPEIVQAAAELISNGASEGPIEDQAEHSGLDARQTRILEDLLDNLLPADLHEAIRQAASRLDEADYPDEDAA